MAWRWPWQKDKKDEPSGETSQTLATFVRGIQHAINTADEIAEQQHPRTISRTFNEDGTPKVVKFKLPDGSEMEVPIICLMPQNTIFLKEVEIHMSVRIDRTEVKKAAPEGKSSDVERCSFHVSIAPGKRSGDRESNVVDMTMKFVSGDPPEGVARIVESYVNMIVPKKGKPGGGSEPPLESPKPSTPPEPPSSSGGSAATSSA